MRGVMETAIGAELEAEIVKKIQALYLDQLSYREIVDKLVEQGYSRSVLVAVIHKMTNQRRLSPMYTGPFVFLIMGIILLAWGSTRPAVSASDLEKTFRLFAVAVGGFVIVPVVLTIVIQWYDRIPGLHTILEPILFKRRLQRLNVKALDQRFLKNELSDSEFERQLIEMLGGERGKRHFRWMRNQKHFGLDLEPDA